MQIAMLHDRNVNRGFVEQREVSRLCDEMKSALRVKTPNMQERIENLSGGNQQKVLIARWLLTNPRILILDEPTRGIDVGAKAEIHRLISRLAGQGVAVIMISSELPEVLGMSDRIMVMHEGHMTGILNRDDADQVKIMELAARWAARRQRRRNRGVSYGKRSDRTPTAPGAAFRRISASCWCCSGWPRFSKYWAGSRRGKAS
ncbi:ATP-binding cassette domain-containing protein [Paracoccus sp. DMF-8]|uniref:ATP-binding cassette domain-containing protein n=1 Tax=Paracoccus sp. DMF-8 TaxID=3019445 RepID=UPI0023E8E9B1|nr:ATP-binding cassette domain-containing protein [Paracoccus sp. DMF-8]MDF3605272.1 ATP-binding cassette domain-containing protein [Paracoccus sp. DMF-8]